MVKAKLCIALLIGALTIGSASATPMSKVRSANDHSGYQARLICYEQRWCYDARYRSPIYATPIQWHIEPRHFINYYTYDLRYYPSSTFIAGHERWVILPGRRQIKASTR